MKIYFMQYATTDFLFCIKQYASTCVYLWRVFNVLDEYIHKSFKLSSSSDVSYWYKLANDNYKTDADLVISKKPQRHN